jgi:hypothetical protein
MDEDGITRYRVGQFQKPIELPSGENQLVCEMRPAQDRADLSVLPAGPQDDGVSFQGIRWAI